MLALKIVLMNNLNIYSITFVLVVFITFPLYFNAQHPQFQPVSKEIKSSVEDRWQQIRQELSEQPGNEWSGEYRAQVDLLTVAVFVWSPINGFIVHRGNDFHPGVEMVNYGKVNFVGNLLTLSPEYLEKDQHTYVTPASFVPVRWGLQHWLIPSNELVLFSYAVNSGAFEEVETYFVKSEDIQKSHNGLPDIPKEYRKYLNTKPINAKVLAIKDEGNNWSSTSLTLNVGKNEGVITGMKFYLIKVKNVLTKLEVTDVAEKTSTGRIISIGTSGSFDKEINPTVGWRFSSKQP